MLKQFAAALLLTALGLPAQAQIYKCVNQYGDSTFSDKPCATTDVGSVVHKGLTPEQNRQQQRLYGQALTNKVIRQSRNQEYSYSTPVPAPSYAESGQQQPKGATDTTGPGNRATISRLLPDGAGIAQRDAANQKREAERRAKIPPAPIPTNITNCVGGFCHDDRGTVYNVIGPNSTTMTSPTGEICQRVGSMIQC